MYTCIGVHICVYIYIYIYTPICIYIYIYICGPLEEGELTRPRPVCSGDHAQAWLIRFTRA